MARAGGNRRKIDVPPGERRRQALRLFQLAVPSLVVIAVLGTLGWLGWSKAIEGDLLRVQEVRFEGALRARPEALMELCPVKPGDHLLLADPDLVERAIARHPWVAGVSVRRVLPPALEVRVTERSPVALVELGGLYLVDDRGQVFKKAAPGDGLDLPLITGLTRRDWLDGVPESAARLDGALALLARWTELRLDRKQPLSQIHLDPDFGTTVWAGDAGVEIRLGTGDVAGKLERMDRVLAAVQAEGRRAAVVHLDNRRRPDWVAVRFADSSQDAPKGRP